MKYNRISKSLYAPLGLVVVAILVVVGLQLSGKIHLFGKAPKPITASEATKGVHFSDSGTTKEGGASKNHTDNSNSENPASSNAFPLTKPQGVFISNHFPNLSGSPAPNQINSVCTTTSGAKCTIVFTKSDVTKSLPAQMTDSGGSTYWTWTLQDIGLTAGTWHVEAKATLGSQTKTTDDLRDLVVSP